MAKVDLRYRVNLVKTDESALRLAQKINFVKNNIFIGTKIKLRPLGGGKDDERILTLEKIEGKHYIFTTKHGCKEAYTMTQLSFDIADGTIKILKRKGE